MHDHNRQIANLIKQGNVHAVNAVDCLVRVVHGDLISDWLPYFVPFAGGVSVHRPPSVGENCIILSPSGEPANGVVLCGLVSATFPSPSKSADETVIAFPDGAKMLYSHVSGSLKISGMKKIEITCPEIQINGDVNVDGKVISNGVVLDTHTHGGVRSGDSNTGQPT